MRSNYLRVMEKPRVARRAMADFMTRAAVDGRVEQLIKKHEGERIDELSAFAAAVDANWLYTLHNMKGVCFGKKRLRRAWEEMVRNRIALREFYRDGAGGYVEQPTGNRQGAAQDRRGHQGVGARKHYRGSRDRRSTI